MTPDATKLLSCLNLPTKLLIVLANRCRICESSSEMIEHLFISCSFATESWRAICGFLTVPYRTFNTTMDMWLFVTRRTFCPHIFQLWVVAVLYTWDFIQQVWHKLVFQEWRFTFHYYLTSLTRWLQMVSIIAKDYIGYLVTDLTILRGLGVQAGRGVPLYLFRCIGFLLRLVG